MCWKRTLKKARLTTYQITSIPMRKKKSSRNCSAFAEAEAKEVQVEADVAAASDADPGVLRGSPRRHTTRPTRPIRHAHTPAPGRAPAATRPSGDASQGDVHGEVEEVPEGQPTRGLGWPSPGKTLSGSMKPPSRLDDEAQRDGQAPHVVRPERDALEREAEHEVQEVRPARAVTSAISERPAASGSTSGGRCRTKQERRRRRGAAARRPAPGRPRFWAYLKAK